MALIDELLGQVEDEPLRSALTKEVESLRSRVIFGLVFEKHIPETAMIWSAPIRPGGIAQRRDKPNEDAQYYVESVTRRTARIRNPEDSGSITSVPLKLLASVKQFGDPVFPGLKSLRAVRRSSSRPFHSVINGESFHALQLLSIFGEDSVDCLYVDPPYNTGAPDWKYNNRFVDKSDRWRHSKWLSFMERRLRIGKTLLKPDGVLVVAIDENEHGHLVCLLEELFVGWDITSVAIVHNPRGVQGDNFSPNNEFAVFVTPPGKKVIAKRRLLKEEPRERRFRVWGDESERQTAKTCFFPIYVQDEGIVGFGEVPSDDFHPPGPIIDLGHGRCEVWPIDNSGVERKWRNSRKTIEGVAHLLSVERVKGTIQIRIDKDTRMHKTVWSGSRYDSGSHGKRLLTKVLGVDFDYPKSLYTMRDVLFACTGDRKDAVILDYLAGSGTTLHATCLLNAEDGGARRCILVTNNEVELKTAQRLHREGIFPGDRRFERHGIFEAVTVPRCTAAITGTRLDGRPVPGEYEGGRVRADGFDENVEFFELTYLDPDEVELGREFEGVLPILWLSAGARSLRASAGKNGHLVSASNGIGILMDDARIREFGDILGSDTEITHVFHATNAPEAFSELVGLVGANRYTRMLYRDYLTACRTNAAENASA